MSNLNLKHGTPELSRDGEEKVQQRIKLCSKNCEL